MLAAMLKNSPAFSGFSVDDLAAAKTFYGRTLGPDLTEENGQLRLHLGGGATVVVYAKPDHAPATYTILNFSVDEIERAVDKLTAAGLRFERYEGIDQDAKGIHREAGPSIAWFTDPAGNILSVFQEKP